MLFANRTALVCRPGMSAGQSVTILSWRRLCAIAGAGKLAVTAVVRTPAPPRISRRLMAVPRRVTCFLPVDSRSPPRPCSSKRPRLLSGITSLSGLPTSLARKDQSELAEVARFRVHFNLSSVLLHDDIVTYRQAETGTFARRLGGEEGREQLGLHLGRHASTIVAHTYLPLFPEIAGG